MMTSSLKKIKNQILSGEVDAVFISSVSHISHLTGYTNFSSEEREAFVLITGDEQYIFTDGRYTEAVDDLVKSYILLELTHKNPLAKHLKNLSDKHSIKKIGIEENNLTVAEYKKIRDIFPEAKGLNIQDVRSVKESWEIRKIELACKLGDRAFEYTLKKIKPGISEKELAFEMEMFIRKKGSPVSFETIAAFGKNSSVPHHHTGESRLENKTEQFILLDFGVKYEGYCSDMTRTVFWKGISGKQKEMYRTVLIAQEMAAEYIDKHAGKKGNAARAAKVANDYILSKGFPAIPHGLGHGVGLEIHEHPRLGLNSKDVLTDGMVFSIEPGIYIPGFGGVRIEDLYVVEGARIRQITHSSNELIIL